MSAGDTSETAGVLRKRRDVLAALCEGPVRKRTLVESLGVPRTTLDRGIRELVDEGLAERVDGGFQATVVGAKALESADRYHAELAGLHEAEALFESLPADTPVDGRFLAGATVSQPDPSVPDGVVDRLFESVRNATRVHGLAPVVLGGHIDTFDTEARTGGAVPKMVLTPAVFDHLVESRPERLREQIREGEFEFFVGPIDARFGLWVADHDDRPSEAGLLVYTDTGVGGVAINDTPEAVRWAHEQYDDARETAEPVTLELIADRLAAGASAGAE
ncbi:helix-turn-helix transcriptional regulator [Halobaculum marinum]|uniref:Helix-turn-helix transcriptional regulator n=1 Tax=Halobaculum marinum TaxID=3031996 RepID=A0ABD5WWS4_9EURY|nr:hypothetical protein [Halobaculum sp. DT55]